MEIKEQLILSVYKFLLKEVLVNFSLDMVLRCTKKEVKGNPNKDCPDQINGNRDDRCHKIGTDLLPS